MTTNSHITYKSPHPHSISLRVTQEELEWLREEALRQERTVASLLRVMLRHYLDTKA